jgi:hypothetical protein
MRAERQAGDAEGVEFLGHDRLTLFLGPFGATKPAIPRNMMQHYVI